MSGHNWRALAKTFRTKFRFPIKAAHNWFPGHMERGLREMQRTLGEADLVIEVHDARIPFSGRNILFKSNVTSLLPHILVLNKKDLVSAGDKDRIATALKEQDPHMSEVIYTDCRSQNCTGLQMILPKAINLIQDSERYHRSEKPDSNILIVGIPNVGKSSLINIMRNTKLRIEGRATSVGNKPGVTRAVMTKIRVCNDPPIYLIDTPGISVPSIKDMHMGLKLALCATLKDDSVGLQYIADYLLFFLNQRGLFDYVQFLQIDEPSDDIKIVLAKAALARNKFKSRINLETGQKQTYPDLEAAAFLFVDAFRSGRLGKVNLDEDILHGFAKKKKPVRLF